MSMRNSDNTVLAWTSFDPLQSQLYSSNGVFYRFDTTSTGSGKRTTTLWRAIKQGKEDKIAKLEWGPNGTLGRAIIGRNTMSMTDLVRPDSYSNSTSFNGPDGFQYWWRRGEYNEILLEDQNRNIIAFFRPFFPCKKYNIGEVYGELCFISDAGAGKVLHPPLMDMVCLTAMLNRIMAPA
ncbi:hypothetical protein FRC03_011530 [Tulasnella sp. 419]|nr:hypothetical protein FRC02_008501 [Tulasnella sp. 418]KAG8966695.1 hypothetical protein FRC03_011530 [Tulasnella sp. 419]